jgi:hypothetical protein
MSRTAPYAPTYVARSRARLEVEINRLHAELRRLRSLCPHEWVQTAYGAAHSDYDGWYLGIRRDSKCSLCGDTKEEITPP